MPPQIEEQGTPVKVFYKEPIQDLMKVEEEEPLDQLEQQLVDEHPLAVKADTSEFTINFQLEDEGSS